MREVPPLFAVQGIAEGGTAILRTAGEIPSICSVAPPKTGTAQESFPTITMFFFSHNILAMQNLAIRASDTVLPHCVMRIRVAAQAAAVLIEPPPLYSRRSAATLHLQTLTPKASNVPEKSANFQWLDVLDFGVGVGPLGDFQEERPKRRILGGSRRIRVVRGRRRERRGRARRKQLIHVLLDASSWRGVDWS